jgi:hypothetical protein
MPSTAITAAIEELIFLMLLGDGTASLGVQRSVGLLGKSHESLLKQALWMRDQAEEALRKENAGGDVQQKDMYKYVTGNYNELIDKWESLQRES